MDFSESQRSISVTNALIEDVSFDRNVRLITISYGNCPTCRRGNQQVVLVINRDTVIRSENGAPMPARELEVGMVIDATFSSAMTRSIPPQAQAFRIRVVNRPQAFETTTGRIVDTNFRNQTITTISNQNPSSVILFHITPETVILNPAGRTVPFSRLVPGLRVRIQHATFMTASIPPQTTAFVIQIM